MRRYNSSKPVTAKPLPPAPTTPAELGELKEWDGQLLHDLKEAAEILTAQLGTGFSYNELRRAIISGEYQEKIHYWRHGRRFKVNIHRIIQLTLS